MEANMDKARKNQVRYLLSHVHNPLTTMTTEFEHEDDALDNQGCEYSMSYANS